MCETLNVPPRGDPTLLCTNEVSPQRHKEEPQFSYFTLMEAKRICYKNKLLFGRTRVNASNKVSNNSVASSICDSQSLCSEMTDK